MSVITLPSKVQFAKVDKLQLLRSGLTMRSRYTGRRQTINFPFACWIFQGTLLPMSGIDAGEWRSFLVELEGQKNTFRLPVPGTSGLLSGYTGAVTLSTGGAAVRSKSALVTGTASTLLFRKGDYFNIGDELKIATAPCTTDASGAATVAFQPAMRDIFLAGVVLTTQNQFIYLAADADESATWTLDKPVKHGIKLTCVEAIGG